MQGTYATFEGAIKKVDPLEGRVILTDGVVIPIEDILGIEAQTPPGQDL